MRKVHCLLVLENHSIITHAPRDVTFNESTFPLHNGSLAKILFKFNENDKPENLEDYCDFFVPYRGNVTPSKLVISPELTSTPIN